MSDHQQGWDNSPGDPYAQSSPYAHSTSQYPHSPYAPQVPRWNLMSISAIVFGFVFAPAGIVLGHVALSQIKRTGEQGRSLAIVGLIAGYVIVAFWILSGVLVIVGLAAHGFAP